MSYESISLLIDDSRPHLEYAVYLASECSPGAPGCRVTLADALEGWLRRSVEGLACASTASFTTSLLVQLFDDIPERAWLELADHYFRILAEWQACDEARNLCVPNPLAP